MLSVTHYCVFFHPPNCFDIFQNVGADGYDLRLADKIQTFTDSKVVIPIATE